MDWSWAGPPIDARPLFPRERAALISLLAELDAADWRRPTVCPGWNVHDIVAHVLHDYLRKLAYWVHQQQIRDGVRRTGGTDDELVAPVIDAFLRAVPHALRDAQAEPGSGLEITVSGRHPCCRLR